MAMNISILKELTNTIFKENHGWHEREKRVKGEKL